MITKCHVSPEIDVCRFYILSVSRGLEAIECVIGLCHIATRLYSCLLTDSFVKLSVYFKNARCEPRFTMSAKRGRTTPACLMPDSALSVQLAVLGFCGYALKSRLKFIGYIGRHKDHNDPLVLFITWTIYIYRHRQQQPANGQRSPQ